jgi:serine/threonine protein kinase, bacterial
VQTSLLNNRYQILQTLGSGGFGQTFLAIDTHLPSQRKCVIKQLKPVVERPDLQNWLQERFQREAAILEELGEGHPQIPRLYAYFAEAGKFFLVQEYVEGVTLKQKVEQHGSLPEKQVWGILAILLSVLEYVHGKRMVHRDIKPDNIILRASDNKPVLIDFGAVKEAMGTVVNTYGKGAASVAIGTPGYMPSEQAAGRPVYSSDLYSLGLTAVFALTGKTPQQWDLDPSTGELLWRSELPSLRSNLAAVLDRVICDHPRDRFPTAAAMRTALRSNAAHSPTVSMTLPAPSPAITALPPQKTPQSPHVVPPTVAARPPQKPPQNQRATAPTVAARPPQKPPQDWDASLSTVAARPTQQMRAATRVPSRSHPSATLPQATTQTDRQTVAVTQIQVKQWNVVWMGLAAIAISFGSLVAGVTLFFAAKQQPQVASVPPTAQPVGNQLPRSLPLGQMPAMDSLPSIPIIPLGTPQREAIATLGKPSSTRNGKFPNTVAVAYDNYVPGQIDLTYIFDKQSSKLRQVEVSFESGTHPEVVRSAFMQTLGGHPTYETMEALRAILDRRMNSGSFVEGNGKGTIQRDRGDRISLIAWEANFR